MLGSRPRALGEPTGARKEREAHLGSPQNMALLPTLQLWRAGLPSLPQEPSCPRLPTAQNSLVHKQKRLQSFARRTPTAVPRIWRTWRFLLSEISQLGCLKNSSQLPPQLQLRRAARRLRTEGAAQPLQSPTPHQPESRSLGLTLPKSLTALSAGKEPGISQGQQHPYLHFSRTPL